MNGKSSNLAEREREQADDRLHEALEDSFPASDPPAITQPRRPESPARTPARRPDSSPTYAGDGVRQGEIVLRRPWERSIFIAGLIGCVLLALALAVGLFVKLG